MNKWYTKNVQGQSSPLNLGQQLSPISTFKREMIIICLFTFDENINFYE